MGLLDDAIREHLELKRRRGADPGEVERAQHEALDPVVRDSAPVDEAGDGIAPAPPSPDHDEGPVDVPEAGVMAGGVPEDMPDDFADAPLASVEPPAPAAAADLGETAELDMRTVLGGDEPAEEPAPGGAPAAPATPSVAGGVRPAPAAAAPLRDEPPAAADDSLEWEMPGDEAGEELEDAEPEDDVLEETPDFLRETPEQDRLWFEQRPPRDFDFNE